MKMYKYNKQLFDAFLIHLFVHFFHAASQQDDRWAMITKFILRKTINAWFNTYFACVNPDWSLVTQWVNLLCRWEILSLHC